MATVAPPSLADRTSICNGRATFARVHRSILASKNASLRPAYKKANAEGRKFIIDSKKVLSIPLGDTWNQSWAEAGFLNAHLKSPKTTVERIAELDRLSRYFAAHPEHEGTQQSITAEWASQLHLALTTANDEFDNYDTVRKDAKQARDKANQELRSMVTGVIVEIRRRLAKDSPLWETFGLTAPKPRAPRPRKEKAPKGTAKSSTARATTSSTEQAAAAGLPN